MTRFYCSEAKGTQFLLLLIEQIQYSSTAYLRYGDFLSTSLLQFPFPVWHHRILCRSWVDGRGPTLNPFPRGRDGGGGAELEMEWFRGASGFNRLFLGILASRFGNSFLQSRLHFRHQVPLRPHTRQIRKWLLR